MTKTRINWIDDTRGICVCCVLLAHCGFEHEYIYLLYRPWFLTTFFFISGFLYKNKSYREDVKRIFTSLVFPYFCLNAILLFLGVDNWSALLQVNNSFLYKKIRSVIGGYQMWFIPCLIMVQLYVTMLFYLFMNTIKRKIITATILLLSVYLIKNSDGNVMPWHSDIALFSTAFFLLGNIVKNRFGFENWLPNLNNRKVIAMLLLLFYWVLSLIMQKYLDMDFHYAYNSYQNPILFTILPLIGIFCICFFFQTFHISALNVLEKNSLTFFAFNGKAKAIVLALLSNFYLEVIRVQ